MKFNGMIPVPHTPGWLTYIFGLFPVLPVDEEGEKKVEVNGDAEGSAEVKERMSVNLLLLSYD